MEQIAQTGYCAHPVRLHGPIEQADPQTGEVRTISSTNQEPDATLLKGCGNRRASPDQGTDQGSYGRDRRADARG
jgi:hypothetical protein